VARAEGPFGHLSGATGPGTSPVPDNSRRIQKRLGRLSPIEYEEKRYADHAPAAEQVNLKPHQPVPTGY
jgi:hypothetical protein